MKSRALKKFALLFGVVASFLAGYGALAVAYPAAGMYSRGEYNGYFTNHFDSSGTYVFDNVHNNNGTLEAFPQSINSAAEFIAYVKAKLNGNQQDRTGAAFIINTMIGQTGTTSRRPPIATQIAEWESRVNYAERIGRVTWRANYTYTINSYYQGPRGGTTGSDNDDAFYDETATAPAMIFRNSAGTIVYAIKWLCANPVGTSSSPALQNPPDFLITGTTSLDVSNPAPGTDIHFTYVLRNNGPHATSPQTIDWVTREAASGTAISSGNAGTFIANQSKTVHVETYPVPANATPGTQICRRMTYNPESAVGGGNGTNTVCATVTGNYTLEPAISMTVNGVAVPNNTFIEAGDAIVFTYRVNNTGTAASPASTACSILGLTRTGYYTSPATPDSASDAGYAAPATGCPRSFPVGTTVIATEPGAGSITVPVNRSICRVLRVNPASATTGQVATEVCLQAGARPYARVYGGDVSAGSGWETAPGTCAANSGAAVVGWNRRSTTFAGAGTQYAAYALHVIQDFSTALGSHAAALAQPPAGLSFANTTTNLPAGLFGGSFGSLPCIPDYYGDRPATTPLAAPANLTALTSGVYAMSGDVQLNGAAGAIINPNDRITVYVDGNVRIVGNILYAGGWDLSNMPQFALIVRGNIFVDSGVTQLDGIYIAQQNAGSGGVFHTCATVASGYNPLAIDGSLYGTCGTKLTVNGAVAAHQVRLLRTIGTLAQSTAAETGAAGNAAEVFNYSPAVWLAPPVNDDEDGGYDAITSLPPIL